GRLDEERGGATRRVGDAVPNRSVSTDDDEILKQLDADRRRDDRRERERGTGMGRAERETERHEERDVEQELDRIGAAAAANAPEGMQPLVARQRNERGKRDQRERRDDRRSRIGHAARAA